MAIGSFVAGRYYGAYNAVDVGATDEGYEVSQDNDLEDIAPSDAWGSSVVDGVYRGGNVHIQFTCKEFKPGAVTPFWPWEVLGVMQTYGGSGVTPIGRLASSVAKAMLLTALAGTAYNTAGATTIQTLTAASAVLAKNFDGRILFDSRLRKLPIRLMVLPTEATVSSTTTTKWFSTT